MKDYEALRNPKETMEFFIENVFEIGYKQGYEDGKQIVLYDRKENIDDEYNRGLNDAWDVARKLYKMSFDDYSELFEMKSPYFDFSVQEVLNRIKEYEENKQNKQKQELKIGDEVMTIEYDEKGVVVGDIYYIGRDREPFVMIWLGTAMLGCSVNRLVKTGRHFDAIADILAEMRGAENDK